MALILGEAPSTIFCTREECIVIGALVVLAVLCFKALVVITRAGLRSQTGSNSEHFSVGNNYEKLQSFLSKTISCCIIFISVAEYLGEIGGFKYLFSDKRGILSFSDFLDFVIG